jgi:FKBP-type peptidyl-prolyl cis-trans isomerase 2
MKERKKLFLLLLGIVFVCGCVTDRSTEVVEEGDGVRVDYVGKQEDGTIFDTSLKDVAIEAGIYNQQRDYQPLGFTVGAGEMIAGFDRGVIGMVVAENRTLTIPPEEAYGSYREDLVQTRPREELTSVGITPAAGAQISTIQGMVGTITTVTDTDVVIDFNHELAGKTLIFDVTLVSIDRDTT